ncbi:MAG: type IV secretion system DNA-binding domain-containing protein [Deltaproteobacteria bacterium]|nr:type IV secretion system DNA-binding domain-containing protein [Deltaproteobacteria bacterium]
MGEDYLLIRGGSGIRGTTAYLTRQFYRWEERTRGYWLWDYPVAPEPPFVPFEGHFLPGSPQTVDDARKPTFLSSLAEKIKACFSPEKPQTIPDLLDPPYGPEDILPDIYLSDGDLVEIQIALPSDYRSSKKRAEHFLASQGYACYPLGFEIIGTATQVIIQLTSRERDASNLRTQLQAYAPQATITQERNYLTSLWKPEEYSLVVDFGLAKEGMLPLSSESNLDIDPLIGIIGALSDCEGDEVAAVQILFSPARSPWAESFIRSVLDWDGTSFFADAPELVAACKQKIASPLFGALIRIGANSNRRQVAHNLVRSIAGAMSQFNSPLGNRLVPLTNEGYSNEIHVGDLLERQTHRSGMILNTDELLNFVHFPDSSIQTEKFHRALLKTKPAPGIATNNQLLLGTNTHQGGETEVTLSPDQRMRHMYVVGASGTGKSTLLFNLILQDIHSGQGVAVLDPHGDLIDLILNFIPKDRKEDAILFNPADEEYPIPFNIFSAASETEKTLLASDLTGVFRRLSSSWGDQMNVVLANGILAMLESREGGTLVTLRRFLIDKAFRQTFLKTVRDQEIIYYWEKEFPLLSGRPQASVLTRLDTFLRPKPIRHLVGQKTSRIDFATIMNQRKIFLAKLSHGGIGEENSYLLGALLVAKIHQIALSRQEIEREKRQPFYLYIDEFQNFVTPSMESILSGARKYNLGLILAHQELRQLAAKDKEVASSVLSNPYTRICFRLGEADAAKLASGFSFFDAHDLQSLGIGEAIGRIEQARYDFNLKTHNALREAARSALAAREEVIAASRANFGVPLETVLKELYPDQEESEVTEPLPPQAPPKARKPSVREKEAARPQEAPVLSPDEPQRPAPAGRGGTQHQYLQRLIKRIGQEHGYIATLEEEILSGHGLVDVSLTRDEERIACEISVSTSPTHEIENIQKCLAHGYSDIVLLSHERKKLGLIRRLAEESITDADQERVHYLLPEEFITFLDSKDADRLENEKTVRGYRVKVKYRSGDPQEQKQKQEAIAKLIIDSMKKMER